MTAVAQESRSQLRNREVALERLRERLAGALHVPRARRATIAEPPGGGEADNVGEGIPADFQRTNGKGYWINLRELDHAVL